MSKSRVFIGNQTDREFLREVIAAAGPFDIVLDDGGHHMMEQIVSFEELFPAVQPHGVYLVEDLHTSYWPEYGGSLGQPGTFIEYAKQRVDELNGWHLRGSGSPTDFTKSVTSITFYDSIAVFEKMPRAAPFVTVSPKQNGPLELPRLPLPVLHLKIPHILLIYGPVFLCLDLKMEDRWRKTRPTNDFPPKLS
jgi:hypothetical protein